MARPSELIPGSCYFMVGYCDSDLLVPSIDTLIFVGEDASEDPRVWRFQWPERHADGKPSGDEFLLSDDQLYQVVDLQGLQRLLREIATLHPFKPLRALSPRASPNARALDTLAIEIEKFLADQTCRSMTITIKFTDDGFSLSRRTDGVIEADFFTHPRLDVTEEEKVLALFMAVGIHQHVDYLADKGRTRVLHFTMPQHVQSIIELSRNLLIEVYAMRSDDSLAYSRRYK
jgi:hypothetical protein